MMQSVTTQRWTPERRRELTRTALIEAAAEVFANRGYHGASVQEIAEAAGFTRGAVYSNFGGKEELFFAVVEHYNDAALAAYTTLLEQATAAGTVQLDAIASLWAETQTTSVDSLRLALEFRLFALRNPELRARMAEFERRTEASIAEVIDQQTTRAGVHLDLSPAELATILYAGQQGIQEHVLMCETDHTGLFEQFLRVVIEGAVRRVPATVQPPPRERR